MKGNEVESQGNQNASIRKLWGRSELPSSRAAGLIGPDCGIRTLPFRRVTVWFSKLCWVLQSKRKGEYVSNIPTLQINHTVPVCNKRQAKVTTSREGQIDNTEMQTAHKCATKGHFSPPQGRETEKYLVRAPSPHRQRHEQMVQQALPFPTWTLERQ